jgi:orotidine-5'-phosphate decarboxylase
MSSHRTQSDAQLEDPRPTGAAPARAAATPLARVAVPLDTADRETFRRWCRYYGPRVGVLKVGLEAFARWGPEAVVEAADHAHAVFLDLKLHDIPNTVAAAVQAVRGLGARLLTVHTGGGPAMLAAAVDAAAGEIEILGVTLLTHLDEPALAALDLPGPLPARVVRWAALAAEAGCGGVVCSPREAAALRAGHPRPFRLVTPGIRPATASRDDQRRTATPAEALAAGADLLVIGRPLTAAPDPEKALESLAEELRGTDQ